jgi:hypothetical protein
VDHYLPTIASPSICISKNKTTFAYNDEFAVPCKGFSRTPNALGLQEYEYQGVNKEAMNSLADFGRMGHLGAVDLIATSTLYQTWSR